MLGAVEGDRAGDGADRKRLVREPFQLRVILDRARKPLRPHAARRVHARATPPERSCSLTTSSVSPRVAARSRSSPTDRCGGAPGSGAQRTRVGASSGIPAYSLSSLRWAVMCHGSLSALPKISRPFGVRALRRSEVANDEVRSSHPVGASSARKTATWSAFTALMVPDAPPCCGRTCGATTPVCADLAGSSA